MTERAALMGGELRSDSKPGVGKTIYLNIPLRGEGHPDRSCIIAHIMEHETGASPAPVFILANGSVCRESLSWTRFSQSVNQRFLMLSARPG